MACKHKVEYEITYEKSTGLEIVHCCEHHKRHVEAYLKHMGKILTVKGTIKKIDGTGKVCNG